MKPLAGIIVVLLLSHGVLHSTNVCGDVSGVWDVSGSPYHVTCQITVPSGQVLEVRPGVQIIFDGHYPFAVNGLLCAHGTSDSLVYFTSDSTSNPAGWGGLRFINNQDTNRLDYCIIQYGNATGSDDVGGGICISGSARLAATHSIIRNNRANRSGGGLFCALNTVVIFEDCRLEANSAGLDGGALCLDHTIGSFFVRCEVRGNYATNAGGGLFNYYTDTYFSDCVFAANVCSTSNGGALTSVGSPVFTLCRFDSNYSWANAGGLYFSDSVSVPVLDSCTVIGNSARLYAGGIYSFTSSGRFSDCLIAGNSANSRGGGICCYNLSNPLFRRCVIRDNTVQQNGGGIWCGTVASPAFEDCQIVSNRALDGGGVYSNFSSFPRFSGCAIDSNIASRDGGGIVLSGYESTSPQFVQCHIADNVANSRGGGFFLDQSLFTIENSTVSNNRANQGGGAAVIGSCSIPYSLGMTSFHGCEVMANHADASGGGFFVVNGSCPYFQNTTVCDNSADVDGGAFHFDSLVDDHPVRLMNVTVSGNSAGQYGSGIFCGNNCRLEFHNTILWNDTTRQITFSPTGHNTVTVGYSDVLGGRQGIDTVGVDTLIWQSGNLSTDPLFRNPAAGNCHLSAFACADFVISPCIDAGNPELEDDSLHCDLGLGTIRADMGAYGGGYPVPNATRPEAKWIPRDYYLLESYPNPFNAVTSLRFILNHAARVNLTVYNSLGQRIANLVDEIRQPGDYRVLWNAVDLPSGIYFAHLDAGEFSKTMKLILLK